MLLISLRSIVYDARRMGIEIRKAYPAASQNVLEMYIRRLYENDTGSGGRAIRLLNEIKSHHLYEYRDEVESD